MRSNFHQRGCGWAVAALLLLAPLPSSAQFTFADLPFMASVAAGTNAASPFVPSNTDTNIVGWWIFSKFTNQVTARILTSALTDQSQWSRPLSNSDGASNPFLTLSNNQGNFVKSSTNLTTSSWGKTTATTANQSNFIATAANGECSQTINMGMPGWSYVFEFDAAQATNLEVNPNIQVLFGGFTSNMVLTTTLTHYAYTNNAPASSSTYGWKDTNAANFGTILVYQPTIKILLPPLWDTNYVPTADFSASSWRPVPGVNSLSAGWTISAGSGYIAHSNKWSHSTPYTVYDVAFLPSTVNNSYIWDSNLHTTPDSGGIDNGSLKGAGGAGHLKLTCGGSSFTNNNGWNTNAWGIITAVFNGASSLLQINANNPTNGVLGTPTNSYSFKLFDRSDGVQNLGLVGQKHAEIIFRATADDGPTRTNYIRYLATKYGITL